MPTYGYHCRHCDHSLDAFQKITDESLKLCPKCDHEALQRGPGGGIGLIFKGSGFYKTEYAATPVPDAPAPAPSTGGGGCCPCGKQESCSSA